MEQREALGGQKEDNLEAEAEEEWVAMEEFVPEASLQVAVAV